MKAHNKLMENTLAQMTLQVTQFVEMHSETDREPTSQIDNSTLWIGEEFKESTNVVGNGKIIFDDFDDDDDDDDAFESPTPIDPYTYQEINTCENFCDNNVVDFLSMVEIDSNKDIVNSKAPCQ